MDNCWGKYRFEDALPVFLELEKEGKEACVMPHYDDCVEYVKAQCDSDGKYNLPDGISLSVDEIIIPFKMNTYSKTENKWYIPPHGEHSGESHKQQCDLWEDAIKGYLEWLKEEHTPAITEEAPKEETKEEIKKEAKEEVKEAVVEQTKAPEEKVVHWVPELNGCRAYIEKAYKAGKLFYREKAFWTSPESIMDRFIQKCYDDTLDYWLAPTPQGEPVVVGSWEDAIEPFLNWLVNTCP